jgi:hypothetical protein
VRFSHWGPCARRLLLRTPQPVHRPPPLSCCRIIFNVLDHAAAGAGGRRLQKKPGVAEQGQPPTLHLHKRLLPKIPASLVLMVGARCAAELPLAVALTPPHPTPRPHAAHYLLVSATRVLEGPLWSCSCPIQQPIPSLGNKVFFAHVLVRPTAPHARVALDVDAAPAGWCLLQIKVLLSASTSRVGHGQPATGVSRVVLEKVVETIIFTEAFPAAHPPPPCSQKPWQFLNLDCVPRCAGRSTHPLPVQSRQQGPRQQWPPSSGGT